MVQAPKSLRHRLLVVDDDPDITDLITNYFTAQGFDVTAAHSADQMRQALDREQIDLVLLDIGLPDGDGIALTRTLRERWHGAVIIVSGKGESVDRIVGLEVGADDYVTKPFELRELLARAKSVLRRMGTAPSGSEREVIAFEGWRIDLQARTLHNPQHEEVELTTGEFDLLSVFVRHPNRVLSRDQILDLTRNRPAGPFDRTIDVQVGRLRKKIEKDPEHPALIKAVRGAGYVFTASVSAH
jgi:two-component system, OmpR family, response regulator